MEQAACNNFITMYPGLFTEDDFVIFKGLHHGSNGSNKDNFIEYLQPDFAFVNAPLKTSGVTPNFSTHPYLDALVRIGAGTSNLYWAGINGNLTITCNGYSAVAHGAGRTRDYDYYDFATGTTITADREAEKDINFFASGWYQEAIHSKGSPDYLGLFS